MFEASLNLETLLRWNEVLINGKYIIGASTERQWKNKVYDYDGNLVTDKLPGGRPLFWHGNKYINMTSHSGFNVYDIDIIKERIDSNEEEILIPELSIQIDERHQDIGHFAANMNYLAYECVQPMGMWGAFRELIVIVSLNEQDRKGMGSRVSYFKN